MNYKYIGLALLVAGLFTSCKDKDNDPVPTQNDVENIELKMINGFHDVNVSSDNGWKATKYPDWVGPIEVEGAAGTPMRLFVETNDEENDRTDTIEVALTNGTTKRYAIKQLGTLHDSENGAVVSEADFDLLCGVGFGINVIEDNSGKLAKYYILNSTPINYAKFFQRLRDDKIEEMFQDEKRYISRTENTTGNSYEAVANQLAVNGQLDVTLDAFKLTVKGDYDSKTDNKNKHAYIMQEVMHIVKSRYFNAGLLRSYANEGADVFGGSYKKLIKRIKDNPSNNSNYAEIVNKYGTHIVTYGAMGGELKLCMDMTLTEGLTEKDISGAIDLGVKVINITGDAKYTDKEESIKKNTSISLKVYGGNTSAWTIAPGSSFEMVEKTIRSTENMDKWVEALKKGEKLSLIEIQTIPIWELMPTAQTRENLRKYIVDVYQPEVMKKAQMTVTPRQYRIKGFDVTTKAEKRDSLPIEAIGHAVIYERKIVPGLSETEYSTLLYSGTFGNINKACGFFVGDGTRKPAKVYFEKDGTVKSTLEIDLPGLTQAKQVYIDIDGNVSIESKDESLPTADVSFKN